MPRHPFNSPRGRVMTLDVHGPSLEGNRLGDPATRRVAIYLPPEAEDAGRRFPLLIALAGFTSSGLKMLNWQLFEESLPQRIDRLREGGMGPVIVAMPDAFSSLGGNQYVDSPIFGDWERFLLDDLIPVLERELPVEPGPRHRGLFGKSSGGYGAMLHGLRHGSEWGALACHSGDMGFDVAFLRDMPALADTLARHDFDVTAFVDAFHASPRVDGGDLYAMMSLAFCASYDPDPERPFGVQLPFDPHTAEMVPERWEQWLRWDPVAMIEAPEAQASLRALDGRVFIDCGYRDQYFLHYGSRQFVRKLKRLSIPHHYEEFDGTHSGIDHRMDVSLPWLVERLG